MIQSMEQQEQNIESIKVVGDVASFGIVVGALMNWLPALAALLTVVWTALRIYETRTVQNLIHRRRRK